MKVLIFGGSGMLGHKLVQQLSPTFDVLCTLHGEFAAVERSGIFERDKVYEKIDVADFASVRDVIESAGPDVVINAIGIVKQLPASGNVELALTINSIFPHRMANLSLEYGFRLITMSTDCVFSGSRGMYSENDVPDAQDLYGQSKHWGEVSADNCLTLRTSIIGRELLSQHGLVEWFISQRNGVVKGYSKAIYSGFPTLLFADILVDIIERHPGLSGVYHVSSDPISKFELLTAINNEYGLGVEIIEDTEFVVDRSLNSSRFREATGFTPAPWLEMIERMAADLEQYDKWKDRMN